MATDAKDKTTTKITTTALVLKSVRGSIDYTFQNYCATCGYKLPKEILRCPDCKQKVRTKPWHRPKIIDMKRV
jgi:lipopolysaccharide biosynthesis regulator YciM